MTSKLFKTGRALMVVLAFVAATGPPPAAVAEPEPTWKVFDEVNDATPQPVVVAMLKLAGVGPNDLLCDLGSGDGRVVVTAATMSKAKGYGVDLNPLMVARARANAEKNGAADAATFEVGDIFKADLKKCTAVTLFLWPTVNVRLRPKLLDELQPGTPVISHQHTMGDWKVEKTVWVRTNLRHWGTTEIHRWTVPAKIDGHWKLDVDEHQVDLKINQRYQFFSGSGTVNGRTQRISKGLIEGTKVSFDFAINGKSRRYTGRVTASGGIDGEGWQAKRKE